MLSVGQAADEGQTSPQVASSVTVEVSVEGAGKLALARNIGSLALQLRASGGEGSSAKEGLTTISAFGGSVSEAVANATSGLVDAVVKEPEGPKFKTVIVTRGLETQSYQVVAPGE